MPKFLILFSSIGSGHRSAAQAIAAAVAAKQAGDARVEDALELAGALLQATVVNMYVRVTEHAPQLYRLFYEGTDIDDLEEALSANRVLGMLGAPLLRKFEELVAEYAPDAIICTQQVPAVIVQHLKLRGKFTQPIYIVVTDFMAHSSWLMPGIDGYFLPSELTQYALAARGVPPEILHVTGIPVRLEISEPKPMDAMRARHGLPADRPLLLLFGGGIEPKRVRLMVELLRDVDADGTLVVVSGRNERLAEALEGLGDGPRMQVRQLGMIDYVDDLVAASDLVITKSGGLIVSEVLARGTPMIIIDPIPGQEEWNADFVVSSGAGMQLRMPELVPDAVTRLLLQPERLATMRAQAQTAGRPRAALAIVEQVLKEL